MRNLMILVFFGVFSSCSTINRTSIRMIGGTLKEASLELETEKNWDRLKNSMSSQLKILEGLLYVDKENTDLLMVLTKGYAAEGFAIYETLGVPELIQGKSTPYAQDALKSYARSIQYALEILRLKGISYQNLNDQSKNPRGIVDLLNSKLANNDVFHDSIFFFAQALAGTINLQKDRPEMIAQLSIVKGLFDWVCEARPDYRYGACDIFYASFEASRPKLLGGNPEKGKELFLAAMKKYPFNNLIKVSYIQYSLIPSLEEDDYKQLKVILDKEEENFENSQYFSPMIGTSTSENKNELTILQTPVSLNLFNAIAMKRYKLLKTVEKNLF